MESKLTVLLSVYEDIKEISSANQKAIEKMKSENSILKDSLNSFFIENQELKDNLNSLEKSSEEKRNATNQNLEKVIGEKDKELALFRVHVDTFQQIHNSFLLQIDVKDKELTSSNEEIKRLNKELADQKSLSDKLNLRIEKLETQKEDFLSQKSSWLSEVRQSEDENDLLRNFFQTIQTNLGLEIKCEMESNGKTYDSCNMIIEKIRHLVEEQKSMKEKEKEHETQKEDFSTQKSSLVFEMEQREDENHFLKKFFKKIQTNLGLEIKCETKSSGETANSCNMIIEKIRHLVEEQKSMKKKVTELEAQKVESANDHSKGKPDQDRGNKISDGGARKSSCKK